MHFLKYSNWFTNKITEHTYKTNYFQMFDYLLKFILSLTCAFKKNTRVVELVHKLMMIHNFLHLANKKH